MNGHRRSLTVKLYKRIDALILWPQLPLWPFIESYESGEIMHPWGVRNNKHLLRKGGGLAQIEPKFRRTKLEKSCLFFKLLDLTALVSGKITSVNCQILEILRQNVTFSLFNQPKTE